MGYVFLKDDGSTNNEDSTMFICDLSDVSYIRRLYRNGIWSIVGHLKSKDQEMTLFKSSNMNNVDAIMSNLVSQLNATPISQ